MQRLTTISLWCNNQAETQQRVWKESSVAHDFNNRKDVINLKGTWKVTRDRVKLFASLLAQICIASLSRARTH